MSPKSQRISPEAFMTNLTLLKFEFEERTPEVCERNIQHFLKNVYK
jgi:hypothetical protein